MVPYSKSKVMISPYTAHLDISLLVIFERSPHTKINNLEALFLLAKKHNILRFQISMHNIMGMAVMDGWKKLFHVQSSLTLSEILLLDDPIKQLSSFAIIHHYVEVFFLIVNIVDPYYVRVVLNRNACTSLLRISDSSRAWMDFFFFSIRLAALTTFDTFCVTLYTKPYEPYPSC